MINWRTLKNNVRKYSRAHSDGLVTQNLALFFSIEYIPDISHTFPFYEKAIYAIF